MRNRREFVVGSAAALGAVGLTAQESREVRTAFIGTGNRGTSLVNQVVAQRNVRVTAICDTDPQARDRALSLTASHKPQSFTDYRQMLATLKDIDAVFIATPCDLHAPMSAVCLEAGKYVYCEKPLGITPEQVQNVIDISRKARTFLQIGQQLRYYPRMRAAMEQIHDVKLLGQPFVIKAQRHSTPITEASSRARPQWYLDVKRSGDLIVENAVHNIDVCNWIANSRPTSAFGHGKKYLPKTIPAGTVMMDGFSVEYVYDNDMHLDYSQLYLHPRTLRDVPNGQWYLIFGEKGTLNLSKGMFHPFEGEPQQVIPTEKLEAREDAVGDFYACIREGRKPFADVMVGAVAALTAIMGREAIYKRRMVTWKELGVQL
jgi:myo-inositol 2-dehydrogenase / D-chiro-inositol 1-dehydrogenase